MTKKTYPVELNDTPFSVGHSTAEQRWEKKTVNSKEYKLPNGKKAVFEYDITTGVGKVTLECMDALMAMIADRPQGEWIDKGNWIPVSERFPESCGMYIVTRKIYDCPDTAPFMMSDESWFDGQNTWHNDNRINHKRGYLTDVIAWMPLPKPYEPAERSGKE